MLFEKIIIGDNGYIGNSGGFFKKVEFITHPKFSTWAERMEQSANDMPEVTPFESCWLNNLGDAIVFVNDNHSYCASYEFLKEVGFIYEDDEASTFKFTVNQEHNLLCVLDALEDNKFLGGVMLIQVNGETQEDIDFEWGD